MTSTDNAHLFERAASRYLELKEVIRQAERDRDAYLQVMEGLARLEPSLREPFQKTTGRILFSNRERVIPAPPKVDPDVVQVPNAKGMSALQAAFRNHPGEALTASAVWSILAEKGLDPGGIRNTRRALDRAAEVGVVEKLDDPKDRRSNVYRWISGVVVDPTQATALGDQEMKHRLLEAFPGADASG